jgi:hypothetical protein
MRVKHFPGKTVSILDADFNIAGEVKIDIFIPSEEKYRVIWTYKNTGESETLKVAEWRQVETPPTKISL